MTGVLSSMDDDELSDIEVVYEEVSPQSKIRQELQLLEILRDCRKPIPVNYDAFKECVARLKYTFSQEVVDSIWHKLNDIMTLENEGKLGIHFNKHSLCGRNNCVCGKEQPIIDLTSSFESENDGDHSNTVMHSAVDVDSRVQQISSVYKVQSGSYQHNLRTDKNCSAEVYSTLHRESVTTCEEEVGETHNVKTNRSKNESMNASESDSHAESQHNSRTEKNCSAEVYSTLHRESVTTCEEEVGETHSVKTNRSKNESMNISESDSHVESHRKHGEFKSKQNSEFSKTVDYSCHKRKYCKHYSKENINMSDNVTSPPNKFASSNKTVNRTEINDTCSDRKKIKQKTFLKKSENNKDCVYKNDCRERENKTVNKVRIEKVYNTDTFEHVSSSTSSDNRNNTNSSKTNEEKKKHNIENRLLTSCSLETVENSKSESSIYNSKSVKKSYKKPEKNINKSSDPNIENSNCNKGFYKTENNNSNASNHEKHKAKVKHRSWSENLSRITNNVYELIENGVKTKDDCGKTDGVRRKQLSRSYNHIDCGTNDREQSVVIDAHIQIVHNSKNEGKNKDNSNSSSMSNNKKLTKINKTMYNNSFKEEKLKKFIEVENKKRRKEKGKIISHEWQLIHDRLVQLMVPKIFKGTDNNS